MSQEISNRSSSPYAQIGVIECYWGDIGKRATFSIVGQNDILTAAHVVYDRALGGLCTSFKLYLAADFNNIKNRWDDLGTEISFSRYEINYLSDIYLDEFDDMLSSQEASSDFAIIGLDSLIGERFGKLQLNPYFSSLRGISALAVGYPNNGSGMMANAVTPSLRLPNTWVTRTSDLRPGNSGGPLLVKDNIVGVASAGGFVNSIWGATQARFGDLLEMMKSNDDLLSLPSQNDRQDYRDAANDSAQIFIGFNVDETFAGGGGNDIIDGGAGNDILYGGTGNDKLFGGLGNDQLYGNQGKNYLAGGAGDDQYFITASNNTIQEIALEGTDTVFSSLSLTLLNEVENLTLTGKTKINGIGNALNNSLIGNSQNNKLRGLGGHDVLDGMRGRDTLVGGSGNDTFVLHVRSTVKIEDFFPGEDTLQLSISEFKLTPEKLTPDLELILGFGSKASSPEQRFIYDAVKGNLFYDPDGSGPLIAKTIGLLSPQTTLSSSDFSFI